RAAEIACALLEPLHERMTDPQGAPLRVGDEIIDVQVHADSRVLEHAPHREAADALFFDGGHHATTAGEHALHLEAIIHGQRGAQLTVHGLRTLEPDRARNRAALIGNLYHLHRCLKAVTVAAESELSHRSASRTHMEPPSGINSSLKS